jgi:chromosomal replication initiation ATPase DnaA
MSRLDELYALRKQVDDEIEREHAAITRARRLSCRVVAVTTRGSWSQRVFDASCHHFSVTADDVLSGKRDRVHVDARHVAMWLMRDAGRSYPEIGNEIGVDHSTVMNGVKRVEGDERLLATACEIRAALTGEAAA